MRIVEASKYQNLEGEILSARAAVISEELGVCVMPMANRLRQLASEGVPIWLIGSSRGELPDHKIEGGTKDIISLRYNREGKTITEVWEGIVEVAEESGNEYRYIIELISTLR